KVFLTKSTKYDMERTYFWLPVVIAEWELGSIFSYQWTENANLTTDDPLFFPLASKWFPNAR
ncbi:hypothetical protein, partial [Microcystis sp. M090S1]|uniref:hypothetical protein n=1 Tax=Microcystis sp. M090S1 TaxID=2771135 RepID=UPI00258E3D3C